MKSFEKVYNNSRKNVLSEQQAAFAAEKAALIAAIKHEYGVQDFNSISESEKASYRAMIEEMWTPKTGMTTKGRAFINESAAILTEKSTDEQIEKYFKKEVTANMNNIVSCMVAGTDCEYVKELKTKIESDLKKKLSNKTVKQWLFDAVCVFVGKKAKSIKF